MPEISPEMLSEMLSKSLPAIESTMEAAFSVISKIVGSMDDIFSVIFMLMVIFTFIDGAVRKKGGKSLPSSGDDLDMSILRDDPDITVQREVSVKQPSRQPASYRMKKAVSPSPNSSTQPTRVTESPEPLLTSDDALNAVILSEVFDKPKSLRRR